LQVLLVFHSHRGTRLIAAAQLDAKWSHLEC
jgi:hypothetical protein